MRQSRWKFGSDRSGEMPSRARFSGTKRRQGKSSSQLLTSIYLLEDLKMLNLYRNQFDCFEKRWWDRWNPKWVFLYSTRKISKEFSRCQDEVLVPGNRQHQLSRTSVGRRSEFSNQSINQKASTLLRKIPRWVTLQSDNWFCSNYANKMSICTEVIHPVVRQQSY